MFTCLPIWFIEELYCFGRVHLKKKQLIILGRFHVFEFWGNFFAGIIFESMYTFLENEKILLEKRKRCRQNSWGREDRLLTGKCILRNGKRRHIHLTMVDYRKAYKHGVSCIMECMELLGAVKNIIEFVKRTMKTWKHTVDVLRWSAWRSWNSERNLSRVMFVLWQLLLVLFVEARHLLLRKASLGYK